MSYTIDKKLIPDSVYLLAKTHDCLVQFEKEKICIVSDSAEEGFTGAMLSLAEQFTLSLLPCIYQANAITAETAPVDVPQKHPAPVA